MKPESNPFPRVAQSSRGGALRMRRLQVQVLSRGPFHTETKADQIRRRLEAGWIAVHAVIVGRDHWPPQFYPRSSGEEPPASNRQVEGATPSGDATSSSGPTAEASGLRPESWRCNSALEDQWNANRPSAPGPVANGIVPPAKRHGVQVLDVPPFIMLPQLNHAVQPALTRQVESASLSGSTSFHTTLSSSETGHLTFNQKTRGQFPAGWPIPSHTTAQPNSRGTASRTPPVQVQFLPRAPFRTASIEAMQRPFKPQSRERYPGGPPFRK